jgi:hypothetical protein
MVNESFVDIGAFQAGGVSANESVVDIGTFQASATGPQEQTLNPVVAPTAVVPQHTQTTGAAAQTLNPLVAPVALVIQPMQWTVGGTVIPPVVNAALPKAATGIVVRSGRRVRIRAESGHPLVEGADMPSRYMKNTTRLK